MTSANDMQVGGDHYKAVYQHWDMVTEAGMGYFTGVASKYTARHAKKDGLKDVLKAIHFTRKLMEVLTADPLYQASQNMPYSCRDNALAKFIAANPHITTQEQAILFMLVHNPTIKSLDLVRKELEDIAGSYPSSGYVKQE